MFNAYHANDVFQIELFGFKSGICLLIASVPVRCFSITFIKCHFKNQTRMSEIYFKSCLSWGIVLMFYNCLVNVKATSLNVIALGVMSRLNALYQIEFSMQ